MLFKNYVMRDYAMLLKNYVKRDYAMLLKNYVKRDYAMLFKNYVKRDYAFKNSFFQQFGFLYINCTIVLNFFGFVFRNVCHVSTARTRDFLSYGVLEEYSHNQCRGADRFGSPLAPDPIRLLV